jgi:hypothetical protein
MTTKPITVNYEVEIPRVPNYLILANQPPGTRQEGFREAPKVDIAQVSDEVLTEIGAAWTRALIVVAEQRRKGSFNEG